MIFLKRALTLRIFIILVAFLLAGVLSVVAINANMISCSAKRMLDADTIISNGLEDDVDCILVLGCGVNSDGNPSAMLEDRLIRGIELYKAGVAPKLLMSGDHKNVYYDEVNVMKDYAIQSGVPSEDIFMDHAGLSTYESMYRAKEIFQAEKIIIVTQKYHLYRAIYTAEKLGIDAYGCESDLRTYFGQTKRDLREVLARCKDFFYTIAKPEPEFLGDAIPVNGDGNVTNDR